MKVRFEPFGVTTEVEAGKTLLEAAIVAGVEIESICGGLGVCGKCRVIVSGGVSAPTSLEIRALTEEELAAGYRLACQAIVESDVEVVVPEESRISRVSILVEGIQNPIEVDPWARRHVLQVPPATLEDQISDWENLLRALDVPERPSISLRALQQLPLALREQEGYVGLVLVDDQIIYIGPGVGPEHLLGVAFDIGTTTVVGYLVDLETGEQLAVSSMLNPQTRYGDDVVSRIGHSAKEGGLGELQQAVIGALNKIIDEVTKEAAVSKEEIFALTVVGNTTMYHLFLGISPSALAQSPYVPAVVQPYSVRAAELGVEVYPDARIWVLPNIAGWVGADTVGVILATGLHKHDEIALAIDIGTNGEMALGSRERLITCSTAAGPAFEGAHLSCGMRAADGAIDEVYIDHDVRWHTIGEGAPRGICGSGLVDVVAEMLRVGIIDETGMMRTPEALESDGYKQLARRIVQGERQREFVLVGLEEGSSNRPIKVTQRDVRELQLAKGAIRAGIEILMKELGIGPEDVKHVYLAGAFGNYIKPESALAIGLIPRFPHAEIIPVGNAAGSGAKMALLSQKAREEAFQIVERAEYLELSIRPDFQDEFVEAMIFA
ncbi:MAG: DUF4445 domain-containing protein [Anaerolineae bacterium]|nr:DUF4445 domain-containing protein [Anaerolineae bacterium]